MVYSAWLCCIVLSALENLCGVFKLRCSSFPLYSLLSVLGEKREREKYLWKVLCRIKQSPRFLHHRMFQTEPFSSLESSFSGHTRLSPGCVITVCSGVLLSRPDKSWKTVCVHNWPLERGASVLLAVPVTLLPRSLSSTLGNAFRNCCPHHPPGHWSCDSASPHSACVF